MLNKPPLDELLPKTENRYTLAVLVAKRARQLVDGAQPMIDSASPNLVTLASEEVAESAVVGVPGDHNPTIPIRPDIEAARLAAERDADNDMTFDLLQQVQVIQPEPEPEVVAPRASLIKILGDDGEIYEQDELNVDGSVKDVPEHDDYSEESDADPDLDEEDLAELEGKVEDDDLTLSADIDQTDDTEEEEA